MSANQTTALGIVSIIAVCLAWSSSKLPSPAERCLDDSEISSLIGHGQGYSSSKTVDCDEYNASPPNLVAPGDCITNPGADCISCGQAGSGDIGTGSIVSSGYVETTTQIFCGINGQVGFCNPYTGMCDFSDPGRIQCQSFNTVVKQIGNPGGS